MDTQLIAHVVHYAAVIATPLAGIACLKGDKPVRWATVFVIVSAIVADYSAEFLKNIGVDSVRSFVYPDLIATFLQSSILLFMAVRYLNVWLAIAVIFSGMDFYFDQAFTDAGKDGHTVYVIEANLTALLVFLTLIVASLWSWRGRIRQRTDDAERAEAAKRRPEAWWDRYKRWLASVPPRRPAAAPAATSQ